MNTNDFKIDELVIITGPYYHNAFGYVKEILSDNHQDKSKGDLFVRLINQDKNNFVFIILLVYFTEVKKIPAKLKCFQ